MPCVCLLLLIYCDGRKGRGRGWNLLRTHFPNESINFERMRKRALIKREKILFLLHRLSVAFSFLLIPPFFYLFFHCLCHEANTNIKVYLKFMSFSNFFLLLSFILLSFIQSTTPISDILSSVWLQNSRRKKGGWEGVGKKRNNCVDVERMREKSFFFCK